MSSSELLAKDSALEGNLNPSEWPEHVLCAWAAEPLPELLGSTAGLDAGAALRLLMAEGKLDPDPWVEPTDQFDTVPSWKLVVVYRGPGRFRRASDCDHNRFFIPPLSRIGRMPWIDAALYVRPVRGVSLYGLPELDSAIAVARRWPRIVAHMICESLGYCTPGTAARIVIDGKKNETNWCEWVWSCYGGSARKVLKQAIAARRGHSGYMADYQAALRLVREFAAHGNEPLLASWF